jgi:hypothetical protein
MIINMNLTEYARRACVVLPVMKNNWIVAAVAAVLTGLFACCANSYHGAGYGSGDYPQNNAEAVAPLVVGAALVARSSATTTRATATATVAADIMAFTSWVSLRFDRSGPFYREILFNP